MFEALAKEFSQGPNASEGGGMGVFQRGGRSKPIVEAAFALGPGEVSEPVETTSGYHLIQVTEKMPSRMRPYEEVEKKIKQHLWNMALSRKKSLYLKVLRDQAKVERFLKAGAP